MRHRLARPLVWLGLGLVAGAGIGFWVFRAAPPPDTATHGPGAGAPAPESGDVRDAEAGLLSARGRPSRGPENAGVTIVEFTDYECPFCRRHFETTFPTLLAEYGARVRYVARNLPLRNHPHAWKAAEAAECAHAQARFWEYHDLLFRRAPDLSVGSLKRYAAEAGLDHAAFVGCLDSGAMRTLVARDARAAIELGVTGTPTFFINGRLLVGAQPIEAFRAFIEEATRAGDDGASGRRGPASGA